MLSTSALELGIDIGGLDACVLVGYPGSLISSWQRIGRVGRQRRDGLVVMIGMPDALDQYLLKHPQLFFEGAFEQAVVDPWNELIAGRHLVCAAAEEPLGRDELEAEGERAVQIAERLTRQGKLSEAADGQRFFSFRRRPQRDVHPRAAAQPFAILEQGTGKPLGSIDGQRVYHECHPGAIYLHGGRSFRIETLDKEKRQVHAKAARVDYYTAVQAEKETAILERTAFRRAGEFPIGLGRLKVTVRIRGYQKKRISDGEAFSAHPLEVPPLIFETVGFWVEMPSALPAKFAEQELHFMGGIHAAEHATIGLFPLSAIADRGDIGGISYTGHPQLESPAVFIYDGIPGGAGLAERGYNEFESLVARTCDLVTECDCEDGCPACIQSPKCGNGNKPLDKRAAQHVLELWSQRQALVDWGLEEPPLREPKPIREPVAPAAPDLSRHGTSRVGNIDPQAAPPASPRPRPTDKRVLVFDLETQRSAAEVGGWDKHDQMGVSLGVVYDMQRDAYRTYFEADIDKLLVDLLTADCVIGFNIDRFDLPVLTGYTDADLTRVRTLDLLHEVHQVLGYRLSLAHLCEVNLGESKSGEGLQALEWWKQGRIDLIEQYCRKDVELTFRLYDHGREQGHLLYRDKEDRLLKLPVTW